MISFSDRVFTREEVEKTLNRHVVNWLRKYKELTLPQLMAIPLIENRKNVLVTAPTGSGKTLTAFLSIISYLVDLSEKKRLEDRVYAVYISPLRALNNDIEKNLKEPLEELKSFCACAENIRIAVRTGDTPQNERSKMLKKVPHILITTPESFAILLNSRKFSEAFKPEFVIIDEIHDLCSNKRGVHLSLSLERLNSRLEFTRIGLSATVFPLEEVAKFLVGYKDNDQPRDCMIVNASFSKPFELQVVSPIADLLQDYGKKDTALYKLLRKIISENRTTLIFTNTRSGAESVVFHLMKYCNIEDIEAHHSSLSREQRLRVENLLKTGKLKAVVSSTSLELGIDIGYIDVVVQIGSPKSISRCLQRVGRSGHRLHETSKGVLIGNSHEELLELGVLASYAKMKRLDRVSIPRNCLDVLAQQLVGMGAEKAYGIEEAYGIIRKSYCYSDLSKEDYMSVLNYLAGRYSKLETYNVYSKIVLSEEKFFTKWMGRVIYVTNVGTIPDQVAAVVVDANTHRPLGTLDEIFLEYLVKGDRFVLGGRVYEFLESNGQRVYVKKVTDAKPNVPSWVSEMLPLSYDLATAIDNYRQELLTAKKIDLTEIMNSLNCDENSAKSILFYIEAQKKFFAHKKIKYESKNLYVEKYIDYQKDKINHVFFSLRGRRVNNALSKAFGYYVSKLLGSNIEVYFSDYGFSINVPINTNLDIRNIFESVKSNLEEYVEKAIKNTELFRRRFRHCATRSLMVIRNYKGHVKSVGRQQVSAELILNALEEY
ncbi:MAG: ATP-dependent helicase, partial [Candidatus Micrarchaeota archaeon]|nr:ATP-dependent helicase [Candidatus Micrarchaeota archaeon]